MNGNPVPYGQQMQRPANVVPTGVKVLSVFYYIGAVLLLLVSIALFVGAGVIGSLFASINIPFLSALGSSLFVVIGVFLLILGILYFFVGKGLWQGRDWARIVVVIFSCLGILSGVYSIISGNWGSVVGLAINGVIVWYLLFNDTVKAAFS